MFIVDAIKSISLNIIKNVLCNDCNFYKIYASSWENSDGNQQEYVYGIQQVVARTDSKVIKVNYPHIISFDFLMPTSIDLLHSTSTINEWMKNANGKSFVPSMNNLRMRVGQSSHSSFEFVFLMFQYLFLYRC